MRIRWWCKAMRTDGTPCIAASASRCCGGRATRVDPHSVRDVDRRADAQADGAHIRRSKASWYEILDDLPQYDGVMSPRDKAGREPGSPRRLPAERSSASQRRAIPGQPRTRATPTRTDSSYSPSVGRDRAEYLERLTTAAATAPLAALVEMDAVEVAVARDAVEIEQLAAELATHLAERRGELVATKRWRADDEDVGASLLSGPPPRRGRP